MNSSNLIRLIEKYSCEINVIKFLNGRMKIKVNDNLIARSREMKKYTSFGPKSVDCNAIRPEFFSHAQNAHGHSIFGHSVGHMVLEPNWVHIQRRTDVQDVRVLSNLQVWKAQFGPESDFC